MSWLPVIFKVAERVGFEPTYRLLGGNPISSRARYDRTSVPLRERRKAIIMAALASRREKFS